MGDEKLKTFRKYFVESRCCPLLVGNDRFYMAGEKQENKLKVHSIIELENNCLRHVTGAGVQKRF